MDIAVSEVMKPRTDNLPVKLMEVELTIRWIEGMKEKSLRLKTHEDDRQRRHRSIGPLKAS